MTEPEAAIQRCSFEKVFLKYAVNLQQSNFIEITFWHGCSLVNLMHNFRTPFPKNTSDGLLLQRRIQNPAKYLPWVIWGVGKWLTVLIAINYFCKKISIIDDWKGFKCIFKYGTIGFKKCTKQNCGRQPFKILLGPFLNTLSHIMYISILANLYINVRGFTVNWIPLILWIAHYIIIDRWTLLWVIILPRSIFFIFFLELRIIFKSKERCSLLLSLACTNSWQQQRNLIRFS